jgi:hypothetical protein|tara:strand:- start:357 stop:521 length:165 start_codon:yes stop_codon:yes gene_type:complete
MKSRPGKKLSQLDRLSLIVNRIGKIIIPSKTTRPGKRKMYLWPKFIGYVQIGIN